MVSKDFVPGKPGRGVPAAHGRGGASKTGEPRQAGPPATLGQIIEQAFDVSEHTDEFAQRQAYPIRLLMQRYGLSHNHAALVAAELHREGV
jgi:hypothetical protein